MADYVKAEGDVHLINPALAEYTLCGDAFDLGSDVSDYEWKERKRGPVTCAICAAIIEGCRGVRTRT